MDDDLDKLTPDEIAELRDLLRRNRAESAIVRIVQSLPGVGRYLGSVGKYVAYAKGFGTILTILLLPHTAERAYNFLSPKTDWAIEQVRATLVSWEDGGLDPDSIPPSRDYIAFGEFVPPTTTTTPNPNTIPNVTVVSSSGLSPTIVASSGNAPPPSTWI